MHTVLKGQLYYVDFKSNTHINYWNVQPQSKRGSRCISYTSVIVSVPDALNLGGHKINICTDFKYLFVIFSKSRHFHQARKHNVDHARKAMHILFKRIRNLNIPIDLQLHLFDHVILSIALYGCEIWGFENSQNVSLRKFA